MDKDTIKKSLLRLLENQRIDQGAYDTAIDRVDNPKTVSEQDVIDSIVTEVSK